MVAAARPSGATGNARRFTLPSPTGAYQQSRKERSDEVERLLSSPVLVGKQVTGVVEWKVWKSADRASRHIGLGVVFETLLIYILLVSCITSVVFLIAATIRMQPSGSGALQLATTFAIGLLVFREMSVAAWALLRYVPPFTAPSWGSFLALIIPALLVLAATGKLGMDRIVPHSVHTGVIAALGASAIWTGLYLGMACVLSLIAAGRILWLRLVYPCDDAIDLLAKALMHAQKWCENRAVLSGPNALTGPEIRAHVQAMATARHELLWQLEAIACRIETDLARAQKSGRNRGTVMWFREQARARAAYVRSLKQEVLLPGTLSKYYSPSSDTLVTALSTMLVQAALGDWGAIRQQKVPPVPPSSRLLKALRSLLVIVVPLGIIGILYVLPWHLPRATQTSVIVLLAGISVAHVATLLDPELDKDLGNVDSGIRLLQ